MKPCIPSTDLDRDHKYKLEIRDQIPTSKNLFPCYEFILCSLAATPSFWMAHTHRPLLQIAKPPFLPEQTTRIGVLYDVLETLFGLFPGFCTVCCL
jgi:hypothetical protein